MSMDHQQAGAYWNANAEAWTALSRAGYDVYRDHLNAPAFFDMLLDVSGRQGLDIGCGEGYNTRLMAEKGANVSAIDISEVFIAKAQQAEAAAPLGISYQVASALELPFEAETFDVAIATMSLMDIPDPGKAIKEVHRVLKSDGFFQFSIEHPCFATPHRKNLRDKNGRTYALEVGDYFREVEGDVQEWIFGTAPAALKEKYPKFKVPRFRFTLSQWLNFLIHAGFVIEALQEPRPSDETIAKIPSLQDAQVVAYFLHIRVRKPEVKL